MDWSTICQTTVMPICSMRRCMLLTGNREERDRRIEIVSAPAYAIVRQQVLASIRVHDPSAGGELIRVQIRRDGLPIETRLIPAGAETEIR